MLVGNTRLLSLNNVFITLVGLTVNFFHITKVYLAFHELQIILTFHKVELVGGEQVLSVYEPLCQHLYVWQSF